MNVNVDPHQQFHFFLVPHIFLEHQKHVPLNIPVDVDDTSQDQMRLIAVLTAALIAVPDGVRIAPRSSAHVVATPDRSFRLQRFG